MFYWSVSEKTEKPMIPAVRQQQILHHLGKRKILDIRELTDLLDVSHMTVRRDIQKLEEKGRVVSVTGGVALATQITGEPSHADKRGMQVDEKAAMAKVAETLIGDASTLYLDAGTTTLALARRIAETGRDCEKMLLITNDLVIGAYITENIRCRLYFTGGMVDMENRSCVGDGAAAALRQLNIDIAFLSTPSWNMRWLSIPDQDKSLVKKAVVESSTRCFLLSDSSKYGKVGAFKSVPLSSLDGIVTDAALPEKTREALEQQGIDVMLA